MMSLRAAGSIAPLGLVWVSWVGSWRFTVRNSRLPRSTVQGSQFMAKPRPLDRLVPSRDSPLGLERHLYISSTSLFRFHIQVTTPSGYKKCPLADWSSQPRHCALDGGVQAGGKPKGLLKPYCGPDRKSGGSLRCGRRKAEKENTVRRHACVLNLKKLNPSQRIPA